MIQIKNRRMWMIILIICFSTLLMKAQDVSIIKFNDLLRMTPAKSDTTYFINFFASWCPPCVNEIPEFIQFAEEQKNKKVKVIFVSVDAIDSYKERLIPLIQKLNLTKNTYLLDPRETDEWMMMIDGNWTGSIPTTLVVNNKKHIRHLYIQPLTGQRLNEILQQKNETKN